MKPDLTSGGLHKTCEIKFLICYLRPQAFHDGQVVWFCGNSYGLEADDKEFKTSRGRGCHVILTKQATSLELVSLSLLNKDAEGGSGEERRGGGLEGCTVVAEKKEEEGRVRKLHHEVPLL